MTVRTRVFSTVYILGTQHKAWLRVPQMMVTLNWTESLPLSALQTSLFPCPMLDFSSIPIVTLARACFPTLGLCLTSYRYESEEGNSGLRLNICHMSDSWPVLQNLLSLQKLMEIRTAHFATTVLRNLRRGKRLKCPNKKIMFCRQPGRS